MAYPRNPPHVRPWRDAVHTCVRARCVVALACIMATSSAAIAQARSSREKPALQRAVEMLTQEAHEAKKAQVLPRTEPNFAAEFRDEIPRDELLNALTQTASRDAFVDGYVRWQLTSFNPPLPALDERHMLRLMASAPPMLANPCAEPGIVATFERAKDTPRLSARDAERLRETWENLQRQRTIAETFNAPALGWRKWIENQLPARGPHRILWQIERVASTVNAGWDSRYVKGELTRISRELGRSTGDLALSPQQTHLVCEQIQRMKNLQRRYIDDIALLANGGVSVSAFNAFVSNQDITRWIEALGGTVPK